MSRIISLFVSIIIGLSLSAQIQTKFLGFTLGSTTKSTVYNKYQHEELFNEDEKGDISVGHLVFAGTKWDVTTFYFFNNKLCSVQFYLSEPLTQASLIESTWESMKTKLWDKYSKYYVESSTPKMIMYADDMTYMGITFIDQSYIALSIQYYDITLLMQQNQAEADEL